jgi:hypothetical protein
MGCYEYSCQNILDSSECFSTSGCEYKGGYCQDATSCAEYSGNAWYAESSCTSSSSSVSDGPCVWDASDPSSKNCRKKKCSDFNNEKNDCEGNSSCIYIGTNCAERNSVTCIDYNDIKDLCMANESCGYSNTNNECKLYSGITYCSELSDTNKDHCERKTDCFYGNSNNCFNINSESCSILSEILCEDSRASSRCMFIDGYCRDKVCSYFDNDETKCLNNNIILCDIFYDSHNTVCKSEVSTGICSEFGQIVCETNQGCIWRSESGCSLLSCSYFNNEDQQCISDGCLDLTNLNRRSCSDVLGCYYKEVLGSQSCVTECGVGYDSDDKLGICFVHESHSPDVKDNNSLPSYLFIIIGTVSLIIIVIIISLTVYKIRSKKNSSTFFLNFFLLIKY